MLLAPIKLQSFQIFKSGFLNKDKHVKFREMQYTFKLKCIAFDKSFYFVLKSLKIIYFFFAFFSSIKIISCYTQIQCSNYSYPF